MYGFEDSHSRLRFQVITSFSVRYIPINNQWLFVSSDFGFHKGELSGALWASCFTEEPSSGS